MITFGIVIIVIELAAIGYLLFVLGVQQAKYKFEILRQLNALSEILDDLGDDLTSKLKKYANEFKPKPQTETEYQLEETRKELEQVSGANPPVCQFCHKTTGKVSRRTDGYWVCQYCSVKHFGSVQ